MDTELRHEAVHDSVDPRVIIESVLGEVVKAIDTQRSPVAMELEHYITCARLESCSERGWSGLREAIRPKQRIRRLA